MASQPSGNDGLWARVRWLVDRAPSLDALRAHRIQFLAATLWRQSGHEVPAGLLHEARTGALTTVAAPLLLKRARAAYDGRLMLMKGPEVAANYPVPGARYFHDVDLIADDAREAQRALIKAGFVEVETSHDYAGDDHLCPLYWPGSPLVLEVHWRPSSPTYLSSPDANEVLALGVPSSTGIEGLLAPPPAAHAALLVAHAWTHHAPGRVGDLIDVAAMLTPQVRLQAGEYARSWGWGRMWTATIEVIDALLGDGPVAPLNRTWTRSLAQVREPTVFENHFAQIFAPTVALPMPQALRGIAWALGHTLVPGPDDDWGQKLYRGARVLFNPFQSASRHNRGVGMKPWSR